MNMDKWNSLPDDVKKVMDDLSLEQAIWTGEYMDAHVQEAVEWSKGQGVEFIEPQEKEKWDKALDPIVAKWVEDTKAKGFPAEEIVKDIQAAIAKYSK
jgi:TRAP-type C4-dicarboxylate transport system substrate-binding protein